MLWPVDHCFLRVSWCVLSALYRLSTRTIKPRVIDRPMEGVAPSNGRTKTFPETSRRMSALHEYVFVLRILVCCVFYEIYVVCFYPCVFACVFYMYVSLICCLFGVINDDDIGLSFMKKCSVKQNTKLVDRALPRNPTGELTALPRPPSWRGRARFLQNPHLVEVGLFDPLNKPYNSAAP